MRVFFETNVEIAGQPGPDGEARRMTIGQIEDLIVIAVVHTDRHGATRVIPARPASRTERSIFHGTHNQRET